MRCVDIEPFKIQIAGVTAQIEPLYESTKAYCRNYLTDQPAAYQFSVTKEDLIFEQHMLDVEAQEEGMKRRQFTQTFLERAAIQRKMAEELLLHDTLLLHGSTIAVDGWAYLFTASCGTGKSTHTRLWRETFGERAVMVNDDKPFIKIVPEGVIAYGSPWSGKHGLDTNIAAPLKGICILHRGEENVIRRIEPHHAAAMLHHQSYVSLDPAKRGKSRILVEKLMECIPLWEMYCTKEKEAAMVAFWAMSNM